MTSLDELKTIVKDSTELSRQGRHQDALKMLDSSIASALKQNNGHWIRVLSRHGAAISRGGGDGESMRRYCEQIVHFDPEDVASRYALADLLMRQGRADLARQHARISYMSARSSKSLEAKGVIELILKTWPEFAKMP